LQTHALSGQERGRSGTHDQSLERGVQVGDLGLQALVAARQAGQGLPGCLNGIRGVPGPEPSREVHAGGGRQQGELRAQRLGGGDDQIAQPVAGLGAGLDRAASGEL